MKYKILELVPDLFFIKKDAISGVYNIYTNYGWHFSATTIFLKKLKNPRLHTWGNTYARARGTMEEIVSDFEWNLNRGYMVSIT